jgi:cytochrome c-type biogenesis protein CcmH
MRLLLPFALTLVLAAAGYGWQGNPGLAGAPGKAQVIVGSDPAEWIERRRKFYGPAPGQSAAWLFPADALVRHGDFADGAAILLGATEKNPNDAEAWLALANTLTLHANGKLTPAAKLAYRRAIAVAPVDPAPRYFLALVLEKSGDREAARKIGAQSVPPSAIAGDKPCC